MSELRRDIGLWRGIALNMIDMVGIGPFITIPLILAAMGGGRGMLAWFLGGLLAISDGLVTAELSAEMPASGGSYVFLREALVEMDVPSRQSYVAAVVGPHERTYASSVTNVTRTLMWAAGSTFAGIFMQNVAFSAPISAASRRCASWASIRSGAA